MDDLTGKLLKVKNSFPVLTSSNDLVNLYSDDVVFVLNQANFIGDGCFKHVDFKVLSRGNIACVTMLELQVFMLFKIVD